MSGKRYPEEFRIEAFKQVTERGYPATEAAIRQGISSPTLYKWMKIYSTPEPERIELQGQAAEIRHLESELKRVSEERDILKTRGVLCQGVRVRYVFINDFEKDYPVRRLCSVLNVHPSGYTPGRGHHYQPERRTTSDSLVW